jgi:predicted ATPase/transcriptional regulator with XRE-family HTH domain
MVNTYSFGEWLKQRRKQLKLTQRELATAVYCSTAMIKKIEADERHPSVELAQALAATLQLPPDQHDVFIEIARGKRPLDHLQSPISQSPTSNLPTPTTPFLGRTAELADITTKLRRPNCRLLTLLGSGGMGKTRLAIEAAEQVQSDFADGAVFAPLAAINDPEQIPQAIFQAMRLPLAGNDPPLAQVQRYLQRRHLLLVLDNFEQLTEGATLLSELLAAAPKLQLLVTSRERLNLAEEWLFPVPELDEAVALFGQTAVRVQPDFDVREEETAVSHICQLVGGHPLAVELAASWTRFMPCAQIAAQIEQDLDFLANNAPRNAPERHRSLRALFDHSWQLLTPTEQTALAKLSVFRGGFAVEQATEVAGANWPILLGLVDKSLVETRGDNRFDLHELTRQYAATKLAESGQMAATQHAHFAAYEAFAEQANHWFTSPKAAASFRRSHQEHENYRAALRWGLNNEAIEAVLAFIHNLFAFWLRGGYWQEGEQWMKTAVAQAPQKDSVYLCLALAQQGVFAALQGRFVDGAPKTQRAYQMARRLEEPWPLVVNLQIQGQARPDKEGSLAAYEEAIAICEERLDDPRFNGFLGSLLGLQGDRLVGFGMLAEAKASFEASLSHLRALGDTFWIAYPLGNLGRMALHDGDLEKAYDMINESVSLVRQSANRGGIADWLFRLGQVQLFRGELAEAEMNLQETLQLYEESDNSFGPPGVLSNLALVAVERGDLETAVSLIQDCFTRYDKLRQEARKVNFSVSSDFLEFGDTLDSFLHAGLVTHAQEDWQTAVAFFHFFERNERGYVAIRPLRDRVAAAKAAIQANLSPTAYASAVTQAQQLTLEQLLALWLS